MDNPRQQFAVLGLVVAVLAAVFFVGYNNAARLGLDLQGGLEVVLEAKPRLTASGKKREITSTDIQTSISIIRDRVDKLGVAEPEIRTQGSRQIAVSLPGETDANAAVDVIGSTAQLRFYDFEENLVGGTAYRSAYTALKKNQRLIKREQKKGKRTSAYWLFDKDGKTLAGPEIDKADLFEETQDKQPKDSIVYEVPAGYVLLHGAPDRMQVGVDSEGRFNRASGVWVLMKDKPGLDGNDIKSALGEVQNGGWVTSMNFTGKGKGRFGDVTQKIAQRGALRQTPQHFAIVLDQEVKSAPQIDYTQYPRGIRGGNGAVISGLDDKEEANNLALVLNTGSLPVTFEVVSKTQVSATLGRASLTQGLLAGAAGLGIVMIYLLLFYRFLGLVADLALLAYAAIFYGLIVGIPIVMTLPGIAGMILTIGVAADANIIIFERIREEYRLGRSVRASIANGYRRGLSTIVDASAVTLITALVLFIIAGGGVRGFAFLLGIGTLLSLFTAVVFTFALLGILVGVPLFRHRWAIGGSRKKQRFRHIPWMKARKWMFAWTAVVFIGSFALIGVKHLNLGIDFRSGTRIDVALQQKVSEGDLRATLRKVDKAYGKATIQKTTAPKGTKQVGKSSFVVEVDKLAGGKGEQARQDAETNIRKALESKYGLAEKLSLQTIGPTFGKQIVESAIFAIIVSLILEVMYIWSRFDAKYAIPVLVALVHDVVLALGAYALTGREFKSATIAALLTILGYSLYDTIIVFDRIRENIRIMRKSSFSRIVDMSLNEVLTRSLNTTFVVLLPVAAIFFYGGETLKDFAWALLIGIFAGAYSSLVIAAPILAWIKGREETWKRRALSDSGDEDSRPMAVSDNVDGEVEAPVVPHVQGRRDRRSRSARRPQRRR
jgi:SecD/SecF fusion protein